MRVSAGVYELFAWPVELIQRGGKRAGAVAIGLGLVLIPCGLWLTFGFLGPDHYWPIMLSVSVFGLGLAGAGLAAFVGSQARLAAFDLDAESAPLPNVPVMTAEIPFWVCGSCQIVREGVSVAQRCDQCFSLMDFMAVESEPERKLAAGLLS